MIGCWHDKVIRYHPNIMIWCRVLTWQGTSPDTFIWSRRHKAMCHDDMVLPLYLTYQWATRFTKSGEKWSSDNWGVSWKQNKSKCSLLQPWYQLDHILKKPRSALSSTWLFYSQSFVSTDSGLISNFINFSSNICTRQIMHS